MRHITWVHAFLAAFCMGTRLPSTHVLHGSF